MQPTNHPITPEMAEARAKLPMVVVRALVSIVQVAIKAYGLPLRVTMRDLSAED